MPGRHELREGLEVRLADQLAPADELDRAAFASSNTCARSGEERGRDRSLKQEVPPSRPRPRLGRGTLRNPRRRARPARRSRAKKFRYVGVERQPRAHTEHEGPPPPSLAPRENLRRWLRPWPAGMARPSGELSERARRAFVRACRTAPHARVEPPSARVDIHRGSSRGSPVADPAVEERERDVELPERTSFGGRDDRIHVVAPAMRVGEARMVLQAPSATTRGWSRCRRPACPPIGRPRRRRGNSRRSSTPPRCGRCGRWGRGGPRSSSACRGSSRRRSAAR